MKTRPLQFITTLLAALLVVFLVGPAWAQEVNNGNQTGFPLWGSLHGSGLDTVALNNGNLHIEIPILSVKQRGGHTFTYTYVYDTPTWVLTWVPTPGEPDPGYWYVDQAPNDGDIGWRLSTPTSWNLSYADTVLSCQYTNGQYDNVNVRTDWALIDPDGTKHPLALRQEGGSNYQFPCLGNQLTSPSLDGSGIVANITSSPAVVRLKDGTNVGSGWKDTNGNFATASSDTLDRNLLSKSRVGDTETWTIHDSNGDPRTFQVLYANVAVDTHKPNNDPGLCQFKRVLRETCYDLTTMYSLPDKLILPNGTFYQFQWQQNSPLPLLADLIGIVLPTGGSITYTYAPTGWKFPASDDHHQSVNVRSSVVSRTVNDGQAHTWNYAGYESVAQGTVTTTVTNPPLVPSGPRSREEHDFTLYGTTSFETQVRSYSEQGSLLRTVTKAYGYEPHPYTAYAKINSRVTSETTTLENGQVAQNQTDYETFTSSYPYYGTYTATRLNATEQRAYDYGSGTPGSLLRRTDYTYVHNAVPVYLGLNIVDRVLTTTVYDGAGNPAAQTINKYDTYSQQLGAPGAVNHDETNFGPSYTTRGNLTEIWRWLNTGATYLITHNEYDDTGNVVSTTDPGGHTTQFSYADNFTANTSQPTAAYVTQVTMPQTSGVSHIIRTQYYFNSGLTAATCGQNYPVNTQCAWSSSPSQPDHTTFTYDLMNRPSITRQTTGTPTQPDVAATHIEYNDSSPFSIVVSKRLNASSPSPCGQYDTTTCVVSKIIPDGLGRTVQTQLISDPEGTVYVDTTYDALGRTASVSNPHRAASATTDGTTTYEYDALGRVRYIDLQDYPQNGSRVENIYSGNCTTVIDPTLRMRKSCTDALGRVNLVFEPDGSNLLTWETDYQYNALGDLLRVDQKGDSAGNSANWRTRSFSYDSVSQLTSAVNPESGTINYAYDADGNLTTKQDARGVYSYYSYDPLHRMTVKSFTGGSVGWTYTYDVGLWPNVPNQNSIGRLAYVENSTHNIGQQFSYDAMGRLANEGQCLPSNCGSPSGYQAIQAQYNLAGGLTSLTYPSGRNVSTRYTSAGRLDRVRFETFSGQAVGYDYLNVPMGSPTDPNSWGYHPHGAVKTSVFGNNVPDVTYFNSRLQLVDDLLWRPAAFVVTGANQWQSRTIHWDEPSTGKNNGNVWSIVDNLKSDVTQNFRYDNLNRLQAAWTNGNIWGNTFQLDAWGNLNKIQAYGSKPLGQWLDQMTNVQNRFIGYSYDAAGDLLSDGSTSYQYDAESRIQSVNATGATYTYGPNGERVRKVTGGQTVEYIYFGGQVIGEYNVTTGDWSDYIYASGKRIAKADNFFHEIAIWGTNTTNTQASTYAFSNLGMLAGYAIRTGDQMYFSQYEWCNTEAGLRLTFSDGSDTNWSVRDQYGDYMNQQTGVCQARARIVDLSPFAGRRIAALHIVSEGGTAAGDWAASFHDIALINTDGAVASIYNGQATNPVYWDWSTPGVSNQSSGVLLWPGRYEAPLATTYYHGDHLGSSRLMTGGNGYPVWQGTFLPFGYEYNPQTTTNHYKFTGKERDTESGLDNFGFRYFGSSTGRFMSPDDDSGQDPVDPQSWNLYSYVRNNPLNRTDPNGHDCIYQNPDSGEITGFNRGDCDNSTEEKANSGHYVPGTVDLSSVTYDSSSQSLNYSYTGYDGSAGVGTVVGVPQPQTPSGMSNGAATPLGEQYLAGYALGAGMSRALSAAWGTVAGWFGRGAAESGGAVTAEAAGQTAGQLAQRAGGIIDRIIPTSAGPVRVYAEVVAEGETAVVKDVAIYPAASEGSLQVGYTQMRQGLNGILSDLKAQGFTQARVEAYRLSGAVPGRTMSLTVKLK